MSILDFLHLLSLHSKEAKELWGASRPMMSMMQLCFVFVSSQKFLWVSGCVPSCLSDCLFSPARYGTVLFSVALYQCTHSVTEPAGDTACLNTPRKTRRNDDRQHSTWDQGWYSCTRLVNILWTCEAFVHLGHFNGVCTSVILFIGTKLQHSRQLVSLRIEVPRYSTVTVKAFVVRLSF